LIRKIGVIYQDRNSLGFLRGLRDRLKCEAELIEPPTVIGKTRQLPRRQARLAWMYFQQHGVDLIVRFTDADGNRWAQVRRDELKVFPDSAHSICVCAVAVENVEDWLALDVEYIAELLHLTPSELRDPVHRSGRIKRALSRQRASAEGQSDITARIVSDAPRDVFRRWLEDSALRRFYEDCRAAATRVDCETPNELDNPKDA